MGRICKIIFLIITCSIVLWVALGSINANSANPLLLKSRANHKNIRDFSGEKLVFDISFLWFKNAAVGYTTLQRNGNGYVAQLKAETKGFIGFITGHIKHFYISHMNVVGKSGGVRPYRFEKNIIYRGKEEKIITTLDYKTRTMPWSKTKMGKVVEERIDTIPLSLIYYDILSVFYNFRSSYYGEIKKGKDFLIHAIPEKGESEIRIHVCTREEELKLKKEENIEDSEGYFLVINVPKEIFKTKEGKVLLWATKDLLPLKVIVRDYIGFGDVRGVLREIIKLNS